VTLAICIAVVQGKPVVAALSFKSLGIVLREKFPDLRAGDWDVFSLEVSLTGDEL
jgi:hypothetical protein